MAKPKRPKLLKVTMGDGSIWAVPVEIIARDRAAAYKNEFGDDIERSLKEDTWPLFEDDAWTIEDWAANNMNWSDVKDHAMRCSPAATIDFQDGWVNGDKTVE